MLAPAVFAGTKLALVPGGPHPFFAPWEQAAKDAAKDFKLESRRVQGSPGVEA